jgi:hypothetical protein
MKRAARPPIAGKIDRAEVARQLGYSCVTSVARAHAGGTLPIPFEKIAGRVWYDPADVAAYVRAQRREPVGKHAARPPASILTA